MSATLADVVDPEESCFLREILIDPLDDTTRLAYADWLEERQRQAQAEFIRTSIWAAINKAEDGWTLQPHVHGGGCSWDAGVPWLSPSQYLYGRGFVNCVRLPVADWMPDVIRQIFTRHPITRMTFVDLEPMLGWASDQNCNFIERGKVQSWDWHSGVGESYASILPAELFHEMVQLYPDNTRGTQTYLHRWLEFPTRERAGDALSFTAVTWGRSLVDLPPLPMVDLPPPNWEGCS